MRIEIHRKHMKNLRIRVEDGIVKISAPENMPYGRIMEFIKTQEQPIFQLEERDRERRRRRMLFGKVVAHGEQMSEKELEELYRRELPAVLKEIFQKWNELTGLREKEYRIRKMKQRWGTCYYDRGLILINLKVAERPYEEIEAVVLHELMHLKISNHNEAFYQNMERYIPNYRELDRRLKRWV